MNEKDLEDCKIKTNGHIFQVKKEIMKVIYELNKRSINHDKSKLEEPELTVFAEYTPKLKNCTYGSEEYKQYLKEMKPALDHHYANNSHHPEHFENAINGMNLIDLVEMFCDWLASSKRHSDGNIMKSIKYNKDRFKMTEQLCSIFRNTADIMED